MFLQILAPFLSPLIGIHANEIAELPKREDPFAIHSRRASRTRITATAAGPAQLRGPNVLAILLSQRQQVTRIGPIADCEDLAVRHRHTRVTCPDTIRLPGERRTPGRPLFQQPCLSGYTVPLWSAPLRPVLGEPHGNADEEADNR